MSFFKTLETIHNYRSKCFKSFFKTHNIVSKCLVTIHKYLWFIELKSQVQNNTTWYQSITISKCCSHITSELSAYSFHYNDITINWFNCSKCHVTVALLLKHSFNITKSEATEDWVCSGTTSFKMPVVGREKFCIIVISICFSYSKCLFRGW